MRTRLRSKSALLFVAFAALLLAVAGTTMAPIANPQPEVTTDEDTSKLITLSAIDPENDPLTYKIISLPTNGKLYKGNSTAAADEIKSADLPFTLPGSGNQVTYKPNDNYNGW